MQKTMFLGNLVKDVELKEVGEHCVANFTVVSNDKKKNKSTGVWEDDPFYMDCEIWNEPAKVINQYCKKGSKLFVSGKLKKESWEKDGVKHYRVKLRVEDFEFAGTPPSANTAKVKQSVKKTAQVTQDTNDEADDDVPF